MFLGSNFDSNVREVIHRKGARSISRGNSKTVLNSIEAKNRQSSTKPIQNRPSNINRAHRDKLKTKIVEGCQACQQKVPEGHSHSVSSSLMNYYRSF
jgi:hypothetical protein